MTFMRNAAAILAMMFLLSITLFLGGCAQNDVPVSASVYPAECGADDPSWAQLPDSDVTQSVLARNYQRNKEAFRRMQRNRRICKAGLSL